MLRTVDDFLSKMSLRKSFGYRTEMIFRLLSLSVLNFRIGSSVYLEPLFHRHLIFIDIYVVFIGECACLMVAAVFIICCYILRRSMKKFRTHLQTEGIENQELVHILCKQSHSVWRITLSNKAASEILVDNHHSQSFGFGVRILNFQSSKIFAVSDLGFKSCRFGKGKIFWFKASKNKRK